jgi:hypothetical protein
MLRQPAWFASPLAVLHIRRQANQKASVCKVYPEMAITLSPARIANFVGRGALGL